MRPILLGSRALALLNQAFKIKETSDWDIITDVPLDIPGIEVHDPNILFNSDLERYVESEVVVNGYALGVLNLTGQSIVKRSHLWRSLGFGKHITMYHKWLAPNLTGQYTSADIEVLKKRTKATMEMFPQGYPKLNVSVGEFFDDFVTKKYDHDMLHRMVAFNDAPMYTRMQRDSSSAWCEVDLWEKFSYTEKLECVAEETLVIAIERFMVPNNWKFPSRLAYIKALDKVCTTLCSGWFRDHGIDHYPEVLDMYDSEIFDIVKSKLGEFENV